MSVKKPEVNCIGEDAVRRVPALWVALQANQLLGTKQSSVEIHHGHIPCSGNSKA